MSFLADDEEQGMLTEALAFIDMFALEYDDASRSSDYSTGTDHLYRAEPRNPSPMPSRASLTPSRSTGSKRSVDAIANGNSNGSSGRGAPGNTVESKTTKKKKTKTRTANTTAVHRYRKRNKTEILELREEVLQLETRIAELRIRGALVATTTGPGGAGYACSSGFNNQLLVAPPTTFDDAVLEYRKLVQSEALNRKLKAAMAMQREVNATLEGLFQKQISKNDLSFLLGIQNPLQKKPKARKKSSSFHEDAMLFAALFHHLKDTIYRNTASVLAAFHKNDISCVFSNSVVKKDPRVGRMIECMFNTPVSLNLRQLELLMWNRLTQPIDMTTAAQTVVGPDDKDKNQQFTCTSTNKLGDVIFEYACAIRRFSEPHRIVFAFTSLLTPVGSELLFRENCWAVLSDSQVPVGSSDLSTPAIFQTLYQLHAERCPDFQPGCETPLSPELLRLQDFVMTAQGDRMRAHHLTIQNTLQHPIDVVPIGGILASCLLKAEFPHSH